MASKLKMKVSQITAIVRSDTDSEQWWCELDCGHGQWATGRHKPKRTQMRCAQCNRKPLGGRYVSHLSNVGGVLK